MRRHRWRDFDRSMTMTTIILIGFGVVAVWSARGGGALSLNNSAVKQALFGVVGLAMLVVIASLDYRLLGSLAWIVYLGAVAALAIVLVVGVDIAGSRRWFNFGFTTIQPSEFGKVATLIALAWFISSRGAGMREGGNFFVSLIIVAVPAALVFIEPDLGSALCYVAIWLAMMLVANVRKQHLLAFAVAVGPALLLAWEFVFKDYQRRRLLIAFHPERDSAGDGYNIIQAKISVGSGGLFGQGLQGGTQSRLGLLKVRESDFIFAHVSGMFGFVGMVALIICYGVLLWRCIRAAETAKDQFGQLVAIGFAGLLFFQTFVNIGMNLGVMPVTGITLPFVSQGASSVVAFLIAQGVVQSVLMRRRRLGFQSR